MDTPTNHGGIDFDLFLDAIIAKLSDKEIRERIYKLWV